MTEKMSDIKKLVHKNENKYFWIVLSISVLTYILFILSIVGIFILVGFMALSLFLHALMMGHIRVNGVKIGPDQFPLVQNKAEELCERMGIKQVPDIYIMQSGGVLNAFATRFFGRNMVVLYSEVVELLEQKADEELNFIIAHELAHIKRNHIGKMMFILPSMWIPGLAEMYLRACEYTCDRYAAYYTGNHPAAKNSLTVLAVGKMLYRKVNREEYLQQVNNERGFFVWLAEVLSTHPPLPKRIHEISRFFEEDHIHLTQKKSSKKAIIFAAALMVMVAATGIGGYYLINTFDPFAVLGEEEEWVYEGDETPLNEAVIAGDFGKVNALIEDGEDVHSIDYNGYTPLDWAVMDNNEEMAALLLTEKADPNFESDYGMTAFMTAAESGNIEMIKLLYDAGGDPNYQEASGGYTALMHAVFSGDADSVKLLLELGADPAIKDYSEMTARMHALQSREQEIADLLK